MIFTAYSLCNLELFKLNDKQFKQKTAPKSYKTEIKILANDLNVYQWHMHNRIIFSELLNIIAKTVTSQLEK